MLSSPPLSAPNCRTGSRGSSSPAFLRRAWAPCGAPPRRRRGARPPAFMGPELPPGIPGIIIAGLFAAAMGTLSGTINSVATLLSVDFYEKFRREPPTQKQAVRFAEWMTVLVGLIGVGIAV